MTKIPINECLKLIDSSHHPNPWRVADHDHDGGGGVAAVWRDIAASPAVPERDQSCSVAFAS